MGSSHRTPPCAVCAISALQDFLGASGDAAMCSSQSCHRCFTAQPHDGESQMLPSPARVQAIHPLSHCTGCSQHSPLGVPGTSSAPKAKYLPTSHKQSLPPAQDHGCEPPGQLPPPSHPGISHWAFRRTSMILFVLCSLTQTFSLHCLQSPQDLLIVI